MAKQSEDDFDPYHKWLGIPRKRRPPTHYDLLGLSLNEDDAEVIRSAAEQRRRHVESKRGSGHDSAVAGVLYQIEEAELTLLDPEMRREYDKKLQLFAKRHKKRRVDPNAPRTQVRSRPGKTVGEGNEIVRTFLGLMLVLMVGFGLMAWFSFQLPWSKPPVVDAVADTSLKEATIQQPTEPAVEPQPESENAEITIAEAGPVALAEPSEPPADGGDGFTSLFDGKSLSGWRRYTGGPITEGWIVEDEMLCLRGKGGDIATERQFGDVDLEFEWRMDGGNSGVLYRVRPDDPQAFQSGPEYQIVSGHDPIDSERAFATAGSLYGIAGPSSNQVNAPDDFNHSRIVVQGNHVQHWLNGKQVVDVEMHSPTWNSLVANSKFGKWRQFAKSERGHICLQDTGAEVCFRNIRIRELEKGSQQADRQQSQPLSVPSVSDTKANLLDGSWSFVEGVAAGRPLENAESSRRMVFTGNKYSLITEGKVIEGRIMVDDTQSPKRLDFITESGGSDSYIGKVQPGIYEVTNDGNTLRICVGHPQGPRPTLFDGTPKGWSVQTYERQPLSIRMFDGSSLQSWTTTAYPGHGRVDVVDDALHFGLGKDLTGVTWKGQTLPLSNYEISLEAKRLSGSDFFCGLTFPVEREYCTLILGGWGGEVVGLSSVDGRDASNNDTTTRHRFELNRWYNVRLKVGSDSITAWIDDREFLNQPISGHSFSLRREIESATPLGLTAWRTGAAIRNVVLQTVQ